MAGVVLVALLPGAVLAGLGLASLLWAIERQYQDNPRNWAMGVGLVVFTLGFVILTMSVIVMTVYGWRERRRHPLDRDW
jgi:uncharacterized BrkB/YihY/UPF0761 family membrane protein